MSGRFQTHTVASEGAELDDNYQKMVADIEEQTQRSGWLFGRGAFDKGDLQYLRDFNNSLRYKEVEIEDKEKDLWERERARVEAEVEVAAATVEALTPRKSGGSSAPGLKGLPTSGFSRLPPLVLPVRVKPAASKQQRTAGPCKAPADEPLRCKRARADTAGGAALVSSRSAFPVPSASSAAAAAGSNLRSIKSDPTPAVASAPGTSAPQLHVVPQALDEHLGHSGRQQQVLFERSRASVEASGAVSSCVNHLNDGTTNGLATLLGGYGSEDDEDVVDDCGGETGTGRQQHQELRSQRGSGGGEVGHQASGNDGRKGPQLPPPVGLLSPEDLLVDPWVIADGLIATGPQPHDVQGGDAWDSEDAQSSESS